MGERVAYVCVDPGVPVFGTKGASVHVQEIVRAWRARGAEVTLYCSRLGDRMPADLADLRVVHRPVPTAAAEDPRERTAARERAQADVGAQLAQQVVRDGADVVHERYSLFSTALAEVTDRLGIDGILEVNAPLVEEQRTHRHLVDEAGARRVLRTQVAAAAVVPCVSAPVAAWVRDQADDDGRILVVPNGVDAGRFRPVTRDAGTPVVLFVGTLKPWHGVEILLEAAARARERWRVRLVGDGPERAALLERADWLGLDVDVRGALAPDAVPAAMAGCAVGVAPYPADDAEQYFSPLKVFEYGAAALPVVASAVGQLPAIVRHGQTGLLVPPSDPDALAAAIDALVADPERAAAMGRAGRALMEREHSWSAVLEAILRPLPSLTRAPRGRA